MPPRDLRAYGVAAIVGAVLAILGNAWLFMVDPAVRHDMVSWPLAPHDYVWMQVFFAMTQLLMALGILGLARSDAVVPGRGRRAFASLAVAGMFLTVPGELVLIAVRHDRADASAVGMASTVFGVGVLFADIGLVGFGASALRQHRWPRHWAALPLVLGLFQLLVVTPVSIAAGFASVSSNVAIGIADLMTAVVGVRLILVSAQSRVSTAQHRVMT